MIIETDGQLGTVVSSERFKEAIKPMDKASEAILALKPVTFRYKHELDPMASRSSASWLSKWKRWIPTWWHVTTKASLTRSATKR